MDQKNSGPSLEKKRIAAKLLNLQATAPYKHDRMDYVRKQKSALDNFCDKFSGTSHTATGFNNLYSKGGTVAFIFSLLEIQDIGVSNKKKRKNFHVISQDGVDTTPYNNLFEEVPKAMLEIAKQNPLQHFYQTRSRNEFWR